MMKKSSLLLIPLVIATLFTACAKEKKEVQPATEDRFRTLNTRNPNQNVSVVCHNCTAKFKVSMKMMKSGSTIVCPVCHKDHSHKVNH